MAAYVGSRVKLTADDGQFEGNLQSFDLNNGRVSLSKVFCVDSKKQMKGVLHFFKKEIQHLEPLEPKPKKSIKKDTASYDRLVAKKCNPQHLKKIKDPDREKMFEMVRNTTAAETTQIDSLTAEAAATVRPDGEAVGPKYLDKDFCLIDKLDDTFRAAVQHLAEQRLFGVSLEGVDIGRSGQLCWLSFCTAQYILVFDMLSLGEHCIYEGLSTILEDRNVLKVIHDCRFVSDMLFHRYSVKLINVFDTQMAAVILDRNRKSGIWPSWVGGLHVLLFEYLDLSPEQVFVARLREQTKKEDEQMWAVRPTSSALLDAVSKNVCYLLKLRTRLIERMLEDFNDGVDIFLSVNRDAESPIEDARYHLPIEFKDFKQNALHCRIRTEKLLDKTLDHKTGYSLATKSLADPLIHFKQDSPYRKPDLTIRGVVPDSVHSQRPSPLSGQSPGKSSVLALGQQQKATEQRVEPCGPLLDPAVKLLTQVSPALMEAAHRESGQITDRSDPVQQEERAQADTEVRDHRAALQPRTKQHGEEITPTPTMQDTPVWAPQHSLVFRAGGNEGVTCTPSQRELEADRRAQNRGQSKADSRHTDSALTSTCTDSEFDVIPSFTSKGAESGYNSPSPPLEPAPGLGPTTDRLPQVGLNSNCSPASVTAPSPTRPQGRGALMMQMLGVSPAREPGGLQAGTSSVNVKAPSTSPPRPGSVPGNVIGLGRAAAIDQFTTRS